MKKDDASIPLPRRFSGPYYIILGLLMRMASTNQSTNRPLHPPCQFHDEGPIASALSPSTVRSPLVVVLRYIYEKGTRSQRFYKRFWSRTELATCGSHMHLWVAHAFEKTSIKDITLLEFNDVLSHDRVAVSGYPINLLNPQSLPCFSDQACGLHGSFFCHLYSTYKLLLGATINVLQVDRATGAKSFRISVQAVNNLQSTCVGQPPEAYLASQPRNGIKPDR